MPETRKFIKLSDLFKAKVPENLSDVVYKHFLKEVRGGKLRAATLTDTFTAGSRTYPDEYLLNDETTHAWLKEALLSERLDRLHRNSETRVKFTAEEAETNFDRITQCRQRANVDGRKATPKAAKAAAQPGKASAARPAANLRPDRPAGDARPSEPQGGTSGPADPPHLDGTGAPSHAAANA